MLIKFAPVDKLTGWHGWEYIKEVGIFENC